MSAITGSPDSQPGPHSRAFSGVTVLQVRQHLEGPLPHPVNPEKYRLSGINPGVDFALFVARAEAGNRRMYYSVNPFSTKLKAKGQQLSCCLLNCQRTRTASPPRGL